MPSFNKVMLIGRLVRDPEMRYSTSGLAVTSFSIAVDRRNKNQQGEKQTDFFRCTAWRQSAEFVSSYASKGRLVAVEGRIELNKFTGQDGIEKQSADVVCDHIEILDSNREQGEGGAAPAAGGFNKGGGSTPGGGQGGGQADSGNGYYPDDEMAAGPNQISQNRAPRPAAQGNANSGGARPAAAPAARPAQAQRPAPRPEPAYPENDFDDSDPFSDE